jgi:hypothetical protein
MTIVYIRWRDACHSSKEYPIKDIGALSELHEVGFLITENEEAVTIGTESEDGATEARNWITIPRAGIVEIRRTTVEKAFPVRRRSKKEC